MARSGEIISKGFRGERPGEHGSGVSDRREQPLRIGDGERQMFRRVQVRNRGCLLQVRSVHQASSRKRVAGDGLARKVRELHLKSFRDLRSQRRRGGHQQHLRRWIVLCLAEQVGGHHRRVRVLVGDHH